MTTPSVVPTNFSAACAAGVLAAVVAVCAAVNAACASAYAACAAANVACKGVVSGGIPLKAIYCGDNLIVIWICFPLQSKYLFLLFKNPNHFDILF